MRGRLIPALALVVYSAILIRVLVFKIAAIQIGTLRFRFPAGADQPNLVPFKTILPYLRGEPNSLIATINVAGNIALFVPIGFLVPFIYRRMTWQKSLVLAVVAGLAIEGMEVAFSIGIFDIDDVILNSAGIMIGYWVSTVFAKS
jgi:glycopeptide antibiotics resistance protein